MCSINLSSIVYLTLATLCILVAFSHQEKRNNEMNIVETAFKNFVTEHQKSYAHFPKEYHHRSAIFRNNLAKIDRLNRKEQKRELGTAKYDVNLFADMTQAEFSRTRLGLKAAPRMKQQVAESKAKLNFKKIWSELLKEEGKTEKEILESLPSSFDWRKYKGTVTDVKDQGQCGSCWSFATTGSVEGQFKIKRNESVSLSEQELLDCDTADQGCSGGLPELAYEQIIKLGGLVNETTYPYDGLEDFCHINKTAKKYTIDGFVSLPPKDEDKMRIWLVKRGPISIGINADQLMHYSSGVLHPQTIECPSGEENLDHATLVVGYGEETVNDKVIPYWIIKNSWTASWGEKGYYRIFRGGNTCGLALMPSSAVLFK